MPNFSGIWTVTQQMQARGASTWPATPGAPTIGTATNAGPTSISVAFTAPTCTGFPASVTGYLATSTPGCFTQTGASSPLVVTGLTTGTSYTFKVKATNATGYGPCSAASNSAVPATLVGQQAYITPGSYSWVAPAGITSVSVVAVGGGGGGRGAGGGLGYKNNVSVSSGSSYTVVVGSGGAGASPPHGGTDSYFNSSGTVKGGGGGAGLGGISKLGGTFTGDGGGNGGAYVCGGTGNAGSGAGGYAGTGGEGKTGFGFTAGQAGAGGGGGGGGSDIFCFSPSGGGGGVGILGQGSNGAGGCSGNPQGRGGSGGANALNGVGGAYGGGGGVGGCFRPGAGGAVRIIWPGNTRSFPSTCTGNL